MEKFANFLRIFGNCMKMLSYKQIYCDLLKMVNDVVSACKESFANIKAGNYAELLVPTLWFMLGVVAGWPAQAALTLYYAVRLSTDSSHPVQEAKSMVVGTVFVMAGVIVKSLF